MIDEKVPINWIVPLNSAPVIVLPNTEYEPQPQYAHDALLVDTTVNGELKV